MPLFNIPTRATATLPNGILQRVLDISRPLLLGHFFDLIGTHLPVQNRLDKMQRMIDHVLRSEDDGRMPRGGVRTEDEEEVRKAIYGGAEIGLGSSPLAPDVVEGAAIAALHV